ncbi:hypothetical protein I2I05_08090 [Hymenobacter sp. BT683]|uniref:DUF3828 domain-containing protein n=1 Tax=Hymenobacter jeongseonensis TaxID=2791027 RepID=A0ABS0IG61_9BACT|nr:hypothetical protein [Hymenobacter jeongseonensis]MBF9237356.1 hypothetical protein [Hymenobacter jeongseonensis]
MKIALVLLGLTLAATVASCSFDATRQEAAKPSAKANQATSPDAVVQHFLTWYSGQKEALGSMPLVPAWLSDDGDTTDVYKVDFKVAEEYLQPFKSSGFLSVNYVANEREEIRKADSVMQALRQWAGPPQGLNYDRVVFSQDPDADLEKLRRTKPAVTINGDTALVFFAQLPKPEDLREGANLEFRLVRQQDKWLVDNIRPVFGP